MPYCYIRNSLPEYRKPEPKHTHRIHRIISFSRNLYLVGWKLEGSWCLSNVLQFQSGHSEGHGLNNVAGCGTVSRTGLGGGTEKRGFGSRAYQHRPRCLQCLLSCMSRRKHCGWHVVWLLFQIAAHEKASQGCGTPQQEAGHASCACRTGLAKLWSACRPVRASRS